MLPQIPDKLSRIDETTVDQHFLLEPTDDCYHIWEYVRRGGFSAGPTNSLISNLKKEPSKLLRNPREAPHKERAIVHSAQALRSFINRQWVEGHGTLVPIPSSKIAGHADYDDRLMRVLQRAFGDYNNVDIRPLIEQIQSTAADHKQSERQKFHDLMANTHINEAVATQPPRPQILIFDDVLNSGKHFKVAQRVLSQRFPGVAIIGVFLARCLPDVPSFDVNAG